MDCTNFAKGIALGAVSGGLIVFLLARPKRRRPSVMGIILRTAGCIIDSVNKTLEL